MSQFSITYSKTFYEMEELEKISKVFYKMTFSTKKAARMKSQKYFLDFKPNEIITGKKDRNIDFFPKEEAILYANRGDQLTEIITNSQHEKFHKIADEDVMLFSDDLDRYYANKLLAGESFSLSKVETMKRIIEMSDKKYIDIAILVDDIINEMSISNHLKKLHFFETLDYWQEYVESRKKEK